MDEPRQYPVPVASDEEVAAFIVRYGKPYDPETDDYHRKPFIADIREGKNDPIYNAHSYHTKVPPRAIIPYILHYSEPGDIILDPFCGSGMTGVAALMCEDTPEDILQSLPGTKNGTRKAILNDLSPASCHIAYNYCNPIDARAFRNAFETIKSQVASELAWLYETVHYEPAYGVYDPINVEVSLRLRNPPSSELEMFKSDPAVERDWELLERSEVESRIGKWSQERSSLREGMQSFIAIPATVQHVLWSDVYKCGGMVKSVELTGRISPRSGRPVTSTVKRPRGCGCEIVLWDAAVDRMAGKVSEVFPCPSCGQQWKKTQIKRVSTIPVLTFYRYRGLKVSRRNGSRTLSPVIIKTSRPTTDFERHRLDEIEHRGTPWPYPNEEIDSKGPQYNRNALSARGVKSLTHFYTTRNLWALSSLWSRIAVLDPAVRNELLFALTATFGRIERMTNYKFGKGGNCCLKGQLYFPSLSIEDNILREFESKIKHVEEFLEVAAIYRRTAVRPMIRCGDAGKLNGIPDNSIDYIFTDPPFGSNIYYSEVNWLYECWLGKKTERQTEAVVHRKNDRGTKTIHDYKHLMGKAFSEAYRVLKPGRHATIEFNNSDGRVFEAIKEALRDSGFEIENMIFLDKVQKTFKQIKGERGEEDVVGHDVIFNLCKPANAKAVRPRIRGDREDGGSPSLEDLVSEHVRKHLRGLPASIEKDPNTYNEEHRTTPFLNTMLMNALIPRGVDVSRLNLPFIESVCGRYFRKVDGRWYLRDEAVGNQQSNGKKGLLFSTPDEVLAIQDETSAIAWLRQSLAKTPMRIGELRPHWMKATVRLTGDLSTQLERFLRENFWLDRSTRRWRIPTAEELAELNDHERQRACHDAERFLEGKFSPPPTDAEVLGWIERLYDAAGRLEEEAQGLVDPGEQPALPEEAVGYYRMMARLLQSVLKENVDGSAYTRASRQCRTAARKVEEHDARLAAGDGQEGSGARQGRLFD